MDVLSKLQSSEVKDFLDHKALQYEHPSFIESDPISIVHRFTKKEDIEIVGFLMATIAWGQRKSIIKSGEKLLQILGDHPHEFVLDYQNNSCPDFIHRTFNRNDLNGFLLGLKACYQKGDLERAFLTSNTEANLYEHICTFRNRFIPALARRTHKHVADPASGSAAKRIVMFLRWMVRPNAKGVDFGIWSQISPAQLYIPLDVHTGNIARKLGLIQRTQNDWKTNEELIDQLRIFDPNDPAKYDFALFGLGAFENF
ncbi:MAG: TIGR02757 family protein [Sphingomonadales bacterium]|nr:TIGR02757 family protein [Sphingomonadales bacterium]